MINEAGTRGRLTYEVPVRRVMSMSDFVLVCVSMTRLFAAESRDVAKATCTLALRKHKFTSPPKAGSTYRELPPRCPVPLGP
jgi:hypothetical protein